ncbi:MAG: Fur family transcriptional regulator [Pseudomonadota bacterium]
MSNTASPVDAAFSGPAHDHDACRADALARAEALCDERGVKLTALRRQVLEIIWSGHRPLGAYDLLSRLAEQRGGKAQPPTVYRALEFLCAQGLVHRVESLNAYIGCSHPGAAHRRQLLICRACGAAAELADPPGLSLLAKDAARHGFQVEAAMVELSGLCALCAARQEAGTA